MEPMDDPKLSELLKEWRVPDAPVSLDARFFGACAPGVRVPDARRQPLWSFLMTGSIRVPVPLMAAVAAILILMAFALLRKQAAVPAVPSVNLAEFRPVQDLNVRVIRGDYEAR